MQIATLESRQEWETWYRKLPAWQPRNYIMGMELGRGTFGEVLIATQVTDSGTHAVAVKRQDLRKVTSRNLFREQMVLQKLGIHDRIIQQKACFMDAIGKRYVQVLQCGLLDLRLYQKVNGIVAPGPFGVISSDMLRGLEHMHHVDVLHRDLSPRNVILRDEGQGVLRACLADFGCATCLTVLGKQDAQPRKCTTELVYFQDHRVRTTLNYASREVLQQARYFKCSDIWSAGVVVAELGLEEQDRPLVCATPDTAAAFLGELPSLLEKLGTWAMGPENERWKCMAEWLSLDPPVASTPHSAASSRLSSQ